MATEPQALKNAFSDTPVDLKEFVESHQATISYLSKYGSVIERAKVNILLKLAAGGL